MCLELQHYDLFDQLWSTLHLYLVGFLNYISVGKEGAFLKSWFLLQISLGMEINKL